MFKMTYGFFCKTFYFNNEFNLIYSKQNSVGKTTLLRAILYALGFNIPNTKNLKFENCKFELCIITDSKKELSITREMSYCHVSNKEGNTKLYFSLPANADELHKIIFENENKNIIENVLGTMYIDQEKGWTLLNRGIVIGSIRFNLEKFIQGVANADCSYLYEELVYTENQIKKYKSMLSVAKYQNQIGKLTQITNYDSYNDKLDKEIAILEFEKKPLSIEKNRLESVLNKNIEFKKYITNMRLHVIDETGKRIPVNEKTIEGFVDSNSYIAAKINIINSRISEINNKINIYKNKQNKEKILLHIDTESMINKFDADISKINIDYIGVENMINFLDDKKNKIKTEITLKTKSNNTLITELHKYISSYAKEMGVDEKYVSASKDYIFTSDLKSLSGAIFHKIVFAFRLAYIKVLENYSNIIVPIILDSPRGKEVDDINIQKMIQILERDFSHHQIIIASIYNYDIKNLKIIELQNQLLEDFD